MNPENPYQTPPELPEVQTNSDNSQPTRLFLWMIVATEVIVVAYLIIYS